MSGALRAVALIGSPRGAGSTSAALADALTAELARQGAACERRFLLRALGDEERWTGLCELLAGADLIVLAAPLYVDSLPGSVTRALERLSAERPWNGRRPGLALVVNCGFPEVIHNQTAIAIARLFAIESGLEWRGALALGGGEAIGGRALERLGRRAMHLRRALTLAAGALAAGESIPSEAVRLMARPLVPPWIYRVVSGVSMRRHARRFGVRRRLDARPYE